MRRAPSTLLAAALTLGASAAIAGDYKCDAEASVCIREMAEHISGRGWIGVEFESAANPVITRVVAGSPAEEAGVKVQDRWIGLDDIRFADKGEKESMQAVKKILVPGARLTFHVLRNGRPLALPLVAGKVPEHIMAQWIGQHVLEHHRAPADEEVVAEQEGARANDGD